MKYISCKNIETKIKELIDTTNESKYLQGIAELILWFFCENKQISYFCNNKTNKKKNCDLMFAYKNFTFNIEVKSPALFTNQKMLDELDKNKAVIQISSPYRNLLTKQINNDIQQNIIDFLNNQFSKEKYGEQIIIQATSPIDNPLFEALAKASEQLPELNEKNINLVFNPPNTEQMGK